MKIHKIDCTRVLQTDINRCWSFFSNPLNLKLLTPEKVFDKINLENFSEMYPGMIITYVIKPVLNFRFTWVTEITQMKKEKYFIDEQRFGPYKFWHHQHLFNETENGVEVRDIVHYVMPMGFIGNLIHKFFVKRELERIFEYRNKKMKLLLENNS
ncbi:MAG: hypothetical protein ACEPO8_05720 [Rhodothermaceae bacterium]